MDVPPPAPTLQAAPHITLQQSIPAVLEPAVDGPAFIHVYKRVGERQLTLHFFEPLVPREVARPCMLLIHSGGWVKGKPETYYRIARTMREMGFLVACVEYRLAHPPSTVADSVADAKDALEYLRTNANELKLDTTRIVACGGSAGAHLAAGLTLFADPETGSLPGKERYPAALVMFNPVIDTSPEGYGTGKIGQGWRELSPLHQVRAGLPPTVIFHGTADKTTPFAGAFAFHSTMLKLGNRCDLHSYGGGDHGYYQQEPVYTQVMGVVRSFCTELGILPSP